MKKKRLTILDIANEAGVSITTVSRVLSNSPLVKPESKEKIRAIIKKNSYIPNSFARSLAGSPPKTIGIIIDELANFFFIEIADSFDRIITKAEYSMHISSSKWDEEKEVKLVQQMISNRVDGIVLAPVSEKSESIKLLNSSEIPFLLINIIPDQKDVAYVSCDNRAGGILVADFLNKLNRQSNFLITGFPHQSLSHRIKSFKSNLNKLSELIHYENICTYEQGYELALKLSFQNNTDFIPSAIFVTNDNVAMGIISGLIEMGISIPEEVAVVGYDDIRLSSFSRIPLTTVSQSVKNIGEVAAFELLEMIQDPEYPIPNILITPQLITRQSAIL
jgi:LacI family transcriptional regulator